MCLAAANMPEYSCNCAGQTIGFQLFRIVTWCYLQRTTFSSACSPSAGPGHSCNLRTLLTLTACPQCTHCRHLCAHPQQVLVTSALKKYFTHAAAAVICSFTQ